jgi:hypothetical protein
MKLTTTEAMVYGFLIGFCAALLIAAHVIHHLR